MLLDRLGLQRRGGRTNLLGDKKQESYEIILSVTLFIYASIGSALQVHADGPHCPVM